MQASSGNSQEAAPASQSAGLVEHFFRHEWSNLVAVLTRAFGIARIDLIEDTVQAAMLEAMHAWKHRGVPENPSGWIHRVARNRILDALRREKVHARAMTLSGQTEEASAELLDRWFEEEELPDSLLRMMFVCCHPSLDQKSQIALSLRVLCGFHVREIASGLLMRPEAVKKRIQRAKAELADARIVMELPTSAEIRSRLAHVHDVLYLLFNEGYSTSHGVVPIRDDICEEAARLCHLLCQCEPTNTPATRALLALMLFHGARLDARLDEAGNVVLLEDQDRSNWDRNLIQIAAGWLAKSIADRPSRYHYEAMIAHLHCTAPSVAATDWSQIVLLYETLLRLHPSPVYRLNHAIAIAQVGDLDAALEELRSLRGDHLMRDYFLVDCAMARVYELASDWEAAIDAYLVAYKNVSTDHHRYTINKRLVAVRNRVAGKQVR